MSRYRDWTNTSDNKLNRIIDNEGLKPSKASIKVKKLVLDFAKEKKINGSYTEKGLFVRANFGIFCKIYKLHNKPTKQQR